MVGMQQQLSIVAGVLMIVFILVPERELTQYNFLKPIYKALCCRFHGLSFYPSRFGVGHSLCFTFYHEFVCE